VPRAFEIALLPAGPSRNTAKLVLLGEILRHRTDPRIETLVACDFRLFSY
jgi:hypothetical protein